MASSDKTTTSLKTDEALIKEYREAPASAKTKMFQHLLTRPNSNGKAPWEQVMKRYVKWRLSKSNGAFDIYDEEDLYQRCLCCFFKAVSEKYQFDQDTKFSTYMYSALEKTINRILVELRKKKRTIQINDRRVSPRFFTDSLNKNVNEHEKSISLIEIIPDNTDKEDISEEEFDIAESILEKCKKYLTPMQYEIFIKGDIQGVVSGKELAKNFEKSEPTISAIKKRKISKVLNQIRDEISTEYNFIKK